MLLSKTIDNLRFPLIVGVVMIHARFSEIMIGGVNVLQGDTFTLYTVVSDFFSDVLGRIAVPLFFFISGFLFFYRSSEFSASVYVGKLKKRVRTLLVPYLLWNLLWVLIYAGSKAALPGIDKTFADCSLSDLLSDLLSVLIIHPICYQFWFIRDLMVVVLCTPLIYALVKYGRSCSVIALGVLWYLGCWPLMPGFSAVAFFFFSAGAWFSLHGRNFVEMAKPFLRRSAFLYMILALADVCSKGVGWNVYVHHAGILVGIVFVVSATAYELESGHFRVHSFLSRASFFIFAFHALPLALLRKALVTTLHPQGEFAFLCLYFFCPVLIIFMGLGGYYLLDRWLPRFTGIITGGR